MDIILEGLESVPWSDLKHAYGSAKDVPELLRSLVARNHQERLSALYRLLGSVWHKGTIYEASSYVIPFLVKMLNTPATPERSLVALLLASIAGGESYFEMNDLEDGEKEGWRDVLQKHGVNFEQQVRLERRWVEATRNMMDPNLQVLYEFMDHDEAELRMAVALALSKYPNHASESLKVLNYALKNEKLAGVLQVINDSISQLSKFSQEQ